MREAAEVAKCIKAELKRHWPGTKFSTKSDYFSGGNSVDIRWTFGPTTKQVEKITKKYQHGHFDGMTDMYEYSPTTTGVSAKFVQTQREIPYPVFQQIEKDYAQALGAEWKENNTRWGDRWISDLTHELVNAFELPCGYQGIKHVSDEAPKAGWLTDFYELIGGIRQERY